MEYIKTFFSNIYDKTIGFVVEKIKGYWTYSRTIFINVVGAVILSANDLVPVLMGIDYEAFFKHSVAVVVGGALAIANVFLRIATVAPVGASPDAKVAAVNAVADVKEEEAAKAAEPVVVTNDTTSPKAE